MSDVFISYARETEAWARKVAAALRAAGFGVWYDEDLPAHRAFSEVIEERLREAKAVIVIWSAGAAKSEWVRAEADIARKAHKLVQLKVDKAELPLPFSQIQCVDLAGWSGSVDAPGWRKIIASVEELAGDASARNGSGVLTRPPTKNFEREYLALPDKPSIAVLPFTDMTGATGQDYFCDGMVMEVVTALSRFSTLFVVAADSSLSYRGSQKGHKDIGRELGVRYLLSGSVRKSGEKVRIAVQLEDAQDGKPIWSERFDGTLDDVFALQDTVANTVAGQIQDTTETAEARRGQHRPTEDLGAYDLYLRGRYIHQRVGRQAIQEAIPLLERAVEEDPQFAHALAYAAFLHALQFRWGWSPAPAETQKRARDLITRALACDHDDPEVLLRCGFALYDVTNDLPTADAMLERSLALNPGSAEAWFHSGILKTYAGDATTALARHEKALRLSPRSPMRPLILGMIGWALLFARRYEEAIPFVKQQSELLPSFEGPGVAMVACLAHLGRIEEARKVLSTLDPGLVEAMVGWFGDPERVLRSGLARVGVNV